DTIVFTPDQADGSDGRVSISYASLCEDIKPGNRILIDDGLLDAEVVEVRGRDVVCRIGTGGLLKPKKGVNFPGAKLSVPALTEKDRQDVAFALEEGVDFIALSFVRSHTEVVELRKMIHASGKIMPVIAKIEKGEALDDIDRIVDAADALMVARGDLGVETSPEEVPLAQRMIVEKAAISGKPVIVATQMLDSMIRNPRPTRAEATDVANAVFEGADAVMLSGETAAGQYPVEAVGMMDRIIRRAERLAYRRGHYKGQSSFVPSPGITDGMARAAVGLADNLDARWIVAFTLSGQTARMLCKYRSAVPVVALTPNPVVARRLSLYWGLTPIAVANADELEKVMQITRGTLAALGMVRELDKVVVLTGVPLSVAGTTNLVRVLQIPKEGESELAASATLNGERWRWRIDDDACIRCGICASICSCGIYSMGGRRVEIHRERLSECFLDMQCVEACPVKAISIAE
ncbi:MAG TPA: pyruvate kinase, partial [Spirochaetota bacterium]|nr:pyruvate kinase [Spirochaetota bacterium]